MSVHTAFEFSQDIQEEVWDYWKAGFSFSDIARAVRKAPGCVHRLSDIMVEYVLFLENVLKKFCH